MKHKFKKDEWTFNSHDRNLDLFSIPIETIFKDDTHWVYLCHIASSPGLTREVYFVDKLDKNAWTTQYQCKNKHDALLMLHHSKGESE